MEHADHLDVNRLNSESLDTLTSQPATLKHLLKPFNLELSQLQLMPQTGPDTPQVFSQTAEQDSTTESSLLELMLMETGESRTLGDPDGEKKDL